MERISGSETCPRRRATGSNTVTVSTREWSLDVPVETQKGVSGSGFYLLCVPTHGTYKPITVRVSSVSFFPFDFS